MGGLISAKFLFLLVVALVVLGPEKLPEAARAAGRLLQEFRRVTGGLQDEVREAFQASDLAGPVEELRAVRDGFREAATGLVSAPFSATTAPIGSPAPASAPNSGPMDQSSELRPSALPAAPALTARPARDGGRTPVEMGLPPGDPSLN